MTKKIEILANTPFSRLACLIILSGFNVHTLSGQSIVHPRSENASEQNIFASNIQKRAGKMAALLRFQPEKSAETPKFRPFLPHWKAEELPFFCKIEHHWGKKMAVPIKFRLGSVEYVDWLEGKD
jgi:hypothetical protein